jgi:hypothetical protein
MLYLGTAREQDTMDKAECPTGPENRPIFCLVGFALSAFAVFIVMVLFEGLFHGGLLRPYYQATASLWRSPAAMQHELPVQLIRQACTALLFTCLYFWILRGEKSSECPVKIGLKLGVKIGLILGLSMFGAYVWLPLPSLEIPFFWLIGNTLLGLLLGAVLGIIYNCKKKKLCGSTQGSS